MTKNLNDGQCHGYNEIEEAGLENAAEQFAEGNKNLENILLDLWEMGIETTACCKGEHTKDHNMENNGFFKFPYIAIKVSDNNRKKLLQLVKYIASEQGVSKPNIVYKNFIFRNENSSVMVFQRTFLSNANANKMFEQMLNAIQKMKNKIKIESSENVNLATELIENISNRELFIGYGVKAIHVNVAHNNNCNVEVKNINDKTKKQKINSKTIQGIKDFCNQFLLNKNSCAL